MRVSEEAVEAAARAICAEWGYVWDAPKDDVHFVPDEFPFYDERPSKALYRRAARAALEAALPHMAPNPWIDANRVEGADMRPFVGLDSKGTLFLCYRAYGMWWEGAQPDARPVMPISVMPLYTLPVDTQASADTRHTHQSIEEEADASE